MDFEVRCEMYLIFLQLGLTKQENLLLLLLLMFNMDCQVVWFN